MARPRKSEHDSANAKLIDAFGACLEDPRLTDITISAITKSAELNRGTFYYHCLLYTSDAADDLYTV